MSVVDSTLRRGACLRVCVLAAFLWMVGPVAAQLPRGTILGVVKDSTGGVIPGASITVTNTDTGMVRTGTTGADGSYRFPALPVGTYEIRAEHPGFQSELQSGLKLNVGQEAVINISLQVGAVEQTVAVTAEAPMIETTTANVSGVVSEDEMRDLPLNARDLLQLATLLPGVVIAKTGQQSVYSGYGTKLSVSGTRFNASLFQFDGQDINSPVNSAGSGAGILMGVETVREFNMVTSAYSAEHGKHTGGVFNAVTKSGTNSLRGSVFEFFRNDKIDTRNFFDRDPENPTKRSDPPPYKRNQFGFALGGPIVKDHTFFFGSYESLRQRLGHTQFFRAPNEGLRQGLLPDPRTGRIERIAVAAAIQPWLDTYPLPTPGGQDYGDGTADYVREINAPTNEDFFSMRIDQKISDQDTLFGRYTFDDGEQVPSGRIGLASGTRDFTRTQYAALSETRLFSPEVINVLLLAYNRSKLASEDWDILALPIESFTAFDYEGGPRASVGVSPLTALEGRSTNPSFMIMNQYQLKDDLFYTHGAHFFKFGFNAQRMQYNQTTFFVGGGSFSFRDLSFYLRGIPSGFTGMMPDSDPTAYVRQSLFGFYAQDDWRVSPRLTLNLGLRHEFVTNPHVLRDRVSNLPNYFTPRQTPDDLVIGNPQWTTPKLGNWAPRVGFAWDPTGSGKTSLRGGAGLFYDQLLAGPILYTFVSAPPFFRNAELREEHNPRFPDAYFVQQDQLGGRPQTESAQHTMEQPTVYKYSLDIQRALSATTSVEVGVAGTRAHHLMRVISVNSRNKEVVDGRLFERPGADVLHPQFGRVRPKQTDSRSSYYGLRMQLNQRYRQGLAMRVAYTWSKTIDTGSAWQGALDFGSDQQGGRYRGSLEKQLAAFDIRHNFVTNFTYDLPGQGLSGVAGNVLGGWQMSGVITVQGGSPFNVSVGHNWPAPWRTGNSGRPDAVQGAKIKYDTRNPDHYFDASAFAIPEYGFLGNVAQNAGIGPGIANFDVVLTKRTPLSEKVNLQFRWEFFNLFNRANFGQPSGSVFETRARSVRSDIGQITSTGGTTSRQIQFGLKLEF